MPATSIAISIKDNVTSLINTMRNSFKRFAKDSEESAKQLTTLQNRQKSLGEQTAKFQAKLDSAVNALKQAQKTFGETADEVNRTKLKKAHDEYNKIQSDLKSITNEAKKAQKQISELEDSTNRANNRVSGSKSGMSSLTKSLASAGFDSMIGSSVKQLFNAQVSSAYGDATGTMISSTLSNAVTGATMGGSVAGPLGAAIGGTIGALSGAISGASQNFEKEDEAFKAYTDEEYKSILKKQQSDLEAGSAVASSRENDLRALKILMQNNEQEAKSFQDTLINIGRRPPFSYALAKSLSLDMLGLGKSPEEAVTRINGIADAAAALAWSESDIETIVSNLDAMEASGTVTAVSLQSLTQKGIDAYQAISDEFGIAKDKVSDKLKDLNAAEVVDAIYSYMGDNARFKGAAGQMESTYSGAKSILESYQEDLQAAMGEGYNNRMKDVMKEQIAFYEGKSGKQLQDAYTMIGQHKADVEGRKVKYETDAFDFIMDPTKELSELYKTEGNEKLVEELQQLRMDFAKAKLFGEDDKMASILAEAQNIADNTYQADTKTQSELKIQIGLLEDIKTNTASNPLYYNADYMLEQASSKGLSSGDTLTNNYLAFMGFDPNHLPGNESGNTPESGSVPESGSAPEVKNNEIYIAYGGTKAPGFLFSMYSGSGADKSGISFSQYAAEMGFGSRAIGIPYIPRNDYLIRAHEGERLLTADEARRYNAGGNGTQVLVTMNGVTIREEADIEKVANELAWQIHKQQMIGVAM